MSLIKEIPTCEMQGGEEVILVVYTMGDNTNQSLGGINPKNGELLKIEQRDGRLSVKSYYPLAELDTKKMDVIASGKTLHTTGDAMLLHIKLRYLDQAITATPAETPDPDEDLEALINKAKSRPGEISKKDAKKLVSLGLSLLLGR